MVCFPPVVGFALLGVQMKRIWDLAPGKTALKSWTLRLKIFVN